jgi:hypothetical protein
MGRDHEQGPGAVDGGAARGTRCKVRRGVS